MKLTILVSLLWLTSLMAEYQGFPVIPDHGQTPGEVCTVTNPDYVEKRYQERIAYCERNVDSWLKKKIYKNYDIPTECRKFYTIDHFIPLSIGGTNSPKNLWPEHKNLKKTRSSLEMKVFTELKAGRITQQQAISIIRKAKLAPNLSTLKQDSTLCFTASPE